MALNVSQFQSSDNFNMAEFNDMISQINTGVNSEIATLTNLINSGAKIQTGSYVGTGTYGASNPCSLTFDFVPSIVVISRKNSLGMSQDADTGVFCPIAMQSVLQNAESGDVYFSFSGTVCNGNQGSYYAAGLCTCIGAFSGHTMTWYYPSGDRGQLNSRATNEGMEVQYYYVAIG